VALLGPGTTIGQIGGAVSEQRGILIQGLIPKEDESLPKSKDAIVITDTACKP